MNTAIRAHTATVVTPIGPFTVITTEDGAVLASGWTGAVDDLLAVISPSLRPTEVTPRAELGAVTKAVRDYHAGQLDAAAEVPVRQRGGEFMEHAWTVLRTVPPGKPVTYTDYAALAGRPRAVRAAASACARNAAALFVPCHRVLRVGGGIGGFRWGVEAKRWLLAHEDRG